MTTEEALDWLGEEGHLENMVSVESAGVDLETNTLSYLVGLSTDDEAGFRGNLSLVVGRIAAWDGEEETVLLEGRISSAGAPRTAATPIALRSARAASRWARCSCRPSACGSGWTARTIRAASR